MWAPVHFQRGKCVLLSSATTGPTSTLPSRLLYLCRLSFCLLCFTNIFLYRELCMIFKLHVCLFCFVFDTKKFVLTEKGRLQLDWEGECKPTGHWNWNTSALWKLLLHLPLFCHVWLFFPRYVPFQWETEKKGIQKDEEEKRSSEA